MANTTGFQQQQPFARSASVRSVPWQRPGARLSPAKAAEEPEENSFAPKLER